MHEVTALDGTSLDCDFKGNLTSHSNGQDYVWDSENRMRHATLTTDPTDTWSYRYDALGRRVAKTAPDGTQTVFVLAGAQVVQEYVNNTRENTYVYASYIDNPIALITKNNETYYYHTGHLYSVEALTDEAGNLAETYNYDAYGKIIIYDAAGNELLESALAQPYGFTDRRLDNETGLYYFRTRYYDVELGRFIAKDIAGYIDGYSAYFSPNFTDPTGMECDDDCVSNCIDNGGDVLKCVVDCNAGDSSEEEPDCPPGYVRSCVTNRCHLIGSDPISPPPEGYPELYHSDNALTNLGTFYEEGPTCISEGSLRHCINSCILRTYMPSDWIVQFIAQAWGNDLPWSKLRDEGDIAANQKGIDIAKFNEATVSCAMECAKWFNSEIKKRCCSNMPQSEKGSKQCPCEKVVE